MRFRRGAKTAGPALDSGQMTLIEHLNELRNRLLKCVLAVFAGLIIAFFLYDHILNFLQGPYQDLCKRKDLNCGNGGLVNIDPIGGFGTRIRFCGYLGVVFALPVILWQVWRFIAPDLYAKEKKYAIPFIVSSLLLFAMGAVVAWITFPKALEWLTAYAGEGTQPLFVIDKYISFVLLLMVGYGVGFQFPVILVTLQLLGVVSSRSLAKNRRTAIVVIAIIAAVVTPGGDPFSMIGLGLPMVIFYEVALLIGRLVERRKRRAAMDS